LGGTRWCSRLRYCAKSRKVAGSIGIFDCHNPPDRTMALGLTQPLREIIIRKKSALGVGEKKAVGAWGWRLCLHCVEIWEPQPPRIVSACNRTVLGLLYLYLICVL
jgi:hypothetical protein